MDAYQIILYSLFFQGELWGWLGALGEGSTELTRATVIAIALLAEFLTVVEFWKTPPATRPSLLSSRRGRALV